MVRPPGYTLGVHVKTECYMNRTAQKGKTQYVHLYSIPDTPIKHTIPLQSTPMLKSCIYTCLIHMFDKVDTAFNPRPTKVFLTT